MMLKNPAAKYSPFPPVRLKDRTWPDVVITKPPVWCSVDLRDGNQSLIEPMDLDRKLRMFKTLVDIGFKEIEIGFPSASQVEFDFARKLIEDNLIPEDVTVQVLTQAREHLIRRTFEALEGAPRAIVHLYNATAPVMRQTVLGMSEDEIVTLASSNAQLFQDIADQHPGTEWIFEYSPEMYSDTELDFSRRVIDAVTDVWQPTPEKKCIINLPTTVEHSTPNIFADMVEWTLRHIKRRDSIVISVHPHNDRGTGTATAELALMAGADRLEGCLFGNGERTGNLDLVNVALNMYVQGIDPELDFSDIDATRRTVEHCNQLPVHPRHPYVGDLVFTSFSGSHQDAIKKGFHAQQSSAIWNVPYLPIDPKDLGRSYEAVIRVNSQSGKGGISYLLESEYKIAMPRRLQIEFSQVVQRAMDQEGTEMPAAKLLEIFQTEYRLNEAAPSYQLSGDGAETTIAASIAHNGVSKTIHGTGSGPIDAFTQALSKAAGQEVAVLDYAEHAVGAGANAQAMAYVEIAVGDQRIWGVGQNPNIVTASIKAILSGAERAGVDLSQLN